MPTGSTQTPTGNRAVSHYLVQALQGELHLIHIKGTQPKRPSPRS
jgi:hypothetical protein